MPSLKPIVGVVGASARAAVHSLTRAGYAAWAVDLFADRDLTRIAPTARCPFADYPHALPALAVRFPPGPVLYTGGLENHPHVLAALAARCPLWGNPPAVVEAVRDPFFASRVWQQTDGAVRCPKVLPATERPDGMWLLKPRRGAGGYGIRPFHPTAPPAAPENFSLQEFVPGRPMSAVFVGGGGDAQILGVTEQLVGEPWLHAARFHYAGTIGPVELPQPTALTLWNFGRALAQHGGLVGLFGVDFLYAAGVAYPVEINPRYPSSAEVIEFASNRMLMLDHDVGCNHPLSKLKQSAHNRVVGKAIYYAPHRFAFPTTGPWDDGGQPFDPWALPAFADIPEAGSAVEAGWPVLTFFAAGSSTAEVRDCLQSRATELDRIFAEGHTR